MSAITIWSQTGLSTAIGDMREAFAKSGYLHVKYDANKPRSLDQNALSHVWCQQVALELREDTALGVKCFCKLHHGVPILRAEDADFREAYDAVIKPLAYEKKLIAMRCWPVTSLMSTAQLSQYLDAVQAGFAGRVQLLYPDERAAA